MKPGDTYREWTIEEQLGQGAFGKVFKVVRRELGHSYYSALKVIRVAPQKGDYYDLKNQGMSDDDINIYYKSIVKDFTTELRVMDALKGHSNIVSYETHTIEKNADGVGWTIYILMELLTPLEQYLDRHTMDAKAVIRLGMDMCTALEACGNFNIIHRDIKPANIFISKFGSFKLGDFGIARQLEKTEGNLSKKGTFNYMAPEVYWGKPYNQTVDIYSLGIVLYRLLNGGRLPLLPPAPDPLDYMSHNKALEQRMNGASFSPPCNADQKLAAVVMKACAFDPKRRYQTPAEMKNALLTVNANEKKVQPYPVPASVDGTETEIEIAKNETEKTDTESVFGNYVANKTETKLDEPPTYVKLEQERSKDEKPKKHTTPGKLITAPPPYQRNRNYNSSVQSENNNSIPHNSPKKNSTVKNMLRQKRKITLTLIAILLSSVILILLLGQCNHYKTLLTYNMYYAGSNHFMNFNEWGNVTKITAGDYHIVGLNADGTVVAIGNNQDNQCDVIKWTDISNIATGSYHTLGLKRDGTVIATGNNEFYQCLTANWSDITAITAGAYHTVGLKRDSTVVTIGTNENNQCNVSDWKNINAIAAGDYHTVGLKWDGTVEATGYNAYNQTDVSNWTVISSIAAGGNHTVGLKSDGTVVATGQNDSGQCDVKSWTNIKAIAAGYDFTVGLKKDGTVISTKYNDQVNEWKNVSEVAAGFDFIVGLKE
ncbi:MAG: protein kinase [Ruminococcus sp.]|nr:protein kinase [Ruminococcus sp.]